MTGADEPAQSAADARLSDIWNGIQSGAPGEHVSVVVPSLSFDPEELSKILGVEYYEERLLVALLKLQDPRARIVFVTSLPVHPDIVRYTLDLLPNSERLGVERRLTMLCAYDASRRPLTQKLLERPRLMSRIRRAIEGSQGAYLTCFNATALEHRLALELDIPLNGPREDLIWIGTKSGSRRIFAEAGVPTPCGSDGIRTKADLLHGLEQILAADPAAGGAVIKLNDSFAGAGNAVVRFSWSTGPSAARPASIEAALASLQPTTGEPVAGFLAKLETMSGIVEQFLYSDSKESPRSPSAQLRIDPNGDPVLLSTHEQVLGGTIGQTYVGCRFPADADHRQAVQARGLEVARVLKNRGVIGRFAVDFLDLPAESDGAQLRGIEINLRMGGTTFPFMALRALVPGTTDPDSGEYVSQGGKTRCYFATDNLRSPAYVGLTPEDFMEIVRDEGLDFDHAKETGPVFHMIGALSEYGRIGVTCIARSPLEAEEMYAGVIQALDRACPDSVAPWTPPTHPLGIPIAEL